MKKSSNITWQVRDLYDNESLPFFLRMLFKHLECHAQNQLPIHFKIIQASRKILKAVDLFVTLATVKLKCLISDNAVQFRNEQVDAREITSVILTGQNRPI